MTSTTTSANPIDQGPKPPFPKQTLPYPGLESQMRPRPAYVFLASDDARFITGEVIGVTGGRPIS